MDGAVSVNLEDSERPGGDEQIVMAQEQGFQAVLVHLLRLIGIGNACNGVCAQQPLLSVEQDQHTQRLRLRLISDGAPDTPIPTERADYRLMLKAIERFVRDSDGALVLGRDRAMLELPLARV